VAFRFKITNDDSEDFTPWYQDAQGGTVLIANKLRAANPDGQLSVERKSVDGAVRLDDKAVNAMLREMRVKGGWSETEITAGHKFPDDPKTICEVCRQKHVE
jgi:glutamate 5-kinase